MKDSDWEERIRKRELRIILRERRMEHEQKRREREREKKERAASGRAGLKELLSTDNKRKTKNDKRPGAEKFLTAYSFIPVTAFDKRYAVPPEWRSSSFNERRQYVEFFRTFIYPYPIPETVLFTAQNRETVTGERGASAKSPYFNIIVLAKKWVNDIAGGGSFYKQNKHYFTRAEAHHFLSTAMNYTGEPSLLKQLFFARCKARNMGLKQCAVVSGVFADKFLNVFNHPLVTQFLDLIGRSGTYQFDSGGLGDLCDFVKAKIEETRRVQEGAKPFSFSGRTIFSVIALVNEWHAELQRALQLRAVLNQAARERRNHAGDTGKHLDVSRWKGMGLAPFSYQTDGGSGSWTITELLTAQALLNEGRKMKNCVASYAPQCARGETALFTVVRTYPAAQITDNMATLEVRRLDRALVQAKEKCNRKVSLTTMNVIRRWAQLNRIKIMLP